MGYHWNVSLPSPANWASLNNQCLTNMNDMVDLRYSTPVMVCEVGMSWTDFISCNSFLSDLISKKNLLQVTKDLAFYIGSRRLQTGKDIHWELLIIRVSLQLHLMHLNNFSYIYLQYFF